MTMSSTLPRSPFGGASAPDAGSRVLGRVEALPQDRQDDRQDDRNDGKDAVDVHPVSRGDRGTGPAAGNPPAADPASPPHFSPDRESRLRAIVYDHADFVARVLRNAGTPPGDVDDDVQRAFIVVARRLDEIHAGAEKSFLLRTALNLAAHARRTVARRREVAAEEAPESDDGLTSPERIAEQRRHRLMLDDVLGRMEENLRTVFVLYEFEELSMAQIAAALEIPPGTVASRLRRAREDFRARVRAIEGVTGSEEKP
jgi:RNA polymerase sigma-70 factor, ECF subfamily